LHQFTGSTTDGASPQGGLVVSGSTLLGMTEMGGSANTGSLFGINLNGTGYTQLHSFVGGASDGTFPFGSLTISGNIAYGFTADGGSASGGSGTLFQINTSGTGFGLLHSFVGGSTDGGLPLGTPLLIGSTICGTSQQGGTGSDGTVFKVNTDGTGFSLFHSFSSAGTDGFFPDASLVASGSTLFGTTAQGGSPHNGTIFQINTSGSGYAVAHPFALNDSEGTNPHGTLTLFNGVLYGTTEGGGSIGGGTIFRMNVDGTGFLVLHNFGGSENGSTGNANDGAEPAAGLTVVGNTLIGTTRQGGIGADGTVFEINPDGTGFNLLASFNGAGNGMFPLGDLTYSNGMAYGMTSQGGSSGKGVIFAVSVPEPSATSLLLMAALLGWKRINGRPARSARAS
jgi:uncharacterized repeat protein (TIGR03803 family)